MHQKTTNCPCCKDASLIYYWLLAITSIGLAIGFSIAVCGMYFIINNLFNNLLNESYYIIFCTVVTICLITYAIFECYKGCFKLFYENIGAIIHLIFFRIFNKSKKLN
jgi:hypothetical protein